MDNAGSRRRVSKAEWLDIALKTLADGGVEAVKIGALAQRLGTSRSGFYWHFRDRRDLLKQLLDYWVHELTEVVAGNPKVLELEPKARLLEIATMVLDFDLAQYDIAMGQWALQDPLAARGVRKAYKSRMDVVGQAFADLGFEGDDLEMRTRLFVCYQSWEVATFRDLSRKRRRELIARRIDLLTRP